MADPKNNFEHIKSLHEEKNILVERKTKYEMELASGCTVWRKKTLTLEITKILRRLTEINTKTKGAALSLYHIFYDVAMLSLPQHIKLRLDEATNLAAQNGGIIKNIKPLNFYSDQDLNIQTEHSRVKKDVQRLLSEKQNFKKEAGKLFQIYNARLTPDETKQFSELFDFLRKIINQP